MKCWQIIFRHINAIPFFWNGFRNSQKTPSTCSRGINFKLMMIARKRKCCWWNGRQVQSRKLSVTNLDTTRYSRVRCSFIKFNGLAESSVRDNFRLNGSIVERHQLCIIFQTKQTDSSTKGVTLFYAIWNEMNLRHLITDPIHGLV